MLKIKYIVTLGIICIFVNIFLCGCGNSIEGTYYEWAFAQEENGKIVFADDGKCLFYGELGDGSDLECGGEYSATENGVIVSLDIGETFEFVEDGDYLLFDGSEKSRWYKDKEQAVKEWEEIVEGNHKYITEHIYYQGREIYYKNGQYQENPEIKLLFLQINNLDSDGNAEYTIYESQAYDTTIGDCFSDGFDATELWDKKKRILEKGEMQFGYDGYQGFINAESDFLVNYEYEISMESNVLEMQIYYDRENYDFREGWYQLDYNNQKNL